MFERYKYIFNIALEAVFLNKFRSMLTALGIIFGVAAVIAMMAIGKGAQKEILDQMKLVGVNNIIISAKQQNAKTIEKKASSGSDNNNTTKSESNQTDRYSPGLTLTDAQTIKQYIASVDRVSPEVIFESEIFKDGRKSTIKITGMTPDFFKVFNLELSEGQMFNDEQLIQGKSVCIIGSSLKSRFFPKEDPIDKEIKCGHLWLKVIGILRSRELGSSTINDLGISDYNNSIYTPVQTLLRRYKDRSLITNASLQEGADNEDQGDEQGMRPAGGSRSMNQVDKIVVQVKESEMIKPTQAILKKMMLRRHGGVEDFEISVPELLLKTQQRTKEIFNFVLAAIASISLLIGGIGIMNIMLASVMERVKEIGIRQAIGARKKDIVLQFLSEATFLSLTGGFIGIILGIIISKLIMQLTDITTIISPLSILVSFGVSVSVGIIFGYMPAKRASEHDPVASLRYE
ncbi:MAG: ABC transporter permease [Bacteroidetes bacterium]|nr:ABC transporter permease [Bacteroidota bacterium]